MKKSIILLAILGVAMFFGFKTAAHAADLYANYQALSSDKVLGKDYSINKRETRSTTAVIAIHGGSIEPGSTELADYVAAKKHDFYSFKGIMSSGNSVLHITSTNFDEPAALKLVGLSAKTLSIHGFTGTEKVTYVGGLDQALVAKIKSQLQAAGFIVAEAPEGLTGMDASNIANRNKISAGAQIEVSSALRSTFFASLSTSGRATKTTEFYRYADALKAALEAK